VLVVDGWSVNDRTRELLREIDGTAAEVFDLATRETAREKVGSQREGYEKGSIEIREKAGKPQARKLAE